MKIQMLHRLGGMLLLLSLSMGTNAQQSISDLDGFKRASTEQGSTVLVPEGKSSTKRPAIILLPFTGGSARDLIERWYYDTLPEQAQKQGFIVVLPTPAGSTQDYNTGSAWTATLDRYTNSVTSDAKELVARFDADPARIALAGYSMGGDLGWALIQRDPERYSGAVVMGSRASYRAKGALERFAKHGGRVHMFMGDSEDGARKAGASAALDALKRAGVSSKYSTAPGGHVTAPPSQFASAVDFVLGYSQGMSSPAAESHSPAVAVIRPATSAQIVEQLPVCDWEPFEDEKSGKSGYKNAQGKITVPARLTMAEEFGSDGLASINENGKWGYINCAGKTFSVMTFDNGPDKFSGGLARFRESGRYGFLNRRGEVVIPAQFENAGEFCRGMASIGSDCSTEQRGEYSLMNCSNTFYIDRKGRAVPTPDDPPTPPDCDPVPVQNKVVGSLPGCNWKPFLDKASGLYGYKDGGKTVVKPRFDAAEEFGGKSLAPARESNYGVGYMTCEGKFFEVMWDGGADAFSEGLVRVERQAGMGYANMRGDLSIGGGYEYGTPFCGGVAKVGKGGCLIERDRKKELRFSNVECPQWRYIDSNGHEVPASRVKASCKAALTEPSNQAASSEEAGVLEEDASDEDAEKEETADDS